MNTPRGIRNNNPTNIRSSNVKWQGLATPPSDGAFCRFINPRYGFRATLVIFRTYTTKYNAKTLSEVLHKWAPPFENNTASYIKQCETATIKADTTLPLNDKKQMVELLINMAKVENGTIPNIQFLTEEAKTGYELFRAS